MFKRCVYLLRKRTPGNRNIKQRVAMNLSRQTAFNILMCWIIECHFVATDGSSVCDFKVEISWNNDVCTFIFMPSIWNRKKNTMTFGAFVFASVLTIVAHEKMTQIETLETKVDKRLWLLWSGWMYLPYLSCSQFFFSTHFSLSCIKWNWRPCKCAVLWRYIAKIKSWNHLFSASSFDGNEWNEWTTFAVAASLLWVAFFSHFQFILIRQCSTSNMLNVISFLSEWHSHLPCFKCNS